MGGTIKPLMIDRKRGATPSRMILRIEIDREADGRWIVDVLDLPGVLSYGATKDEAVANASMLALRVIDERMENGEDLPEFQPDPADTEHVHHHA